MLYYICTKKLKERQMENIKEVPAILEACKRIEAMGGKRIETAPTVVRGGDRDNTNKLARRSHL
jgi:hypothetical protein